jgi:hypothetical protein
VLAAGRYTVRGELTIRGITQPVRLVVDVFGRAPDVLGNPRLGLKATARCNAPCGASRGTHRSRAAAWPWPRRSISSSTCHWSRPARQLGLRKGGPIASTRSVRHCRDGAKAPRSPSRAQPAASPCGDGWRAPSRPSAGSSNRSRRRRGLARQVATKVIYRSINAAAESFAATLETELSQRYWWPRRLDAEVAILDYVETFYTPRDVIRRLVK